MGRRKLEELDLLDNFLFQQLISRGEEGEDFCRSLLETILEKKICSLKKILNIIKEIKYCMMNMEKE